LYFSGRLMVIFATPSRTSNRMALYFSIDFIRASSSRPRR
jgi:hypothetical protein